MSLIIDHVTKKYKNFTAVNDMSLSLEKGKDARIFRKKWRWENNHI